MRPLAPLLGNVSNVLCVRANRIHAVAPTAAANGTIVVAWDPLSASRTSQWVLRRAMCLAALSPADMRVGPTRLVDAGTTVLFDKGSASIIIVSFSATQMLIVHQLDSVTLETRCRYRMPVTAAWLLRAPRLSDGYLLFVGAEEPFVGATFTIDLKSSEVYEQDPPVNGGGRMPRRRRLPKAIVTELPSPLPFQVQVATSMCSTAVRKDPRAGAALPAAAAAARAQTPSEGNNVQFDEGR